MTKREVAKLSQLGNVIGVGPFRRDYWGGAASRDHKGLRVFAAVSCCGPTGLAIDASLCHAPAAKMAALKLARALSTGWQAVMVAIGESLACYGDGRLIGRVPSVV
jgi:hypothetical protein